MPAKPEPAYSPPHRERSLDQIHRNIFHHRSPRGSTTQGPRPSPRPRPRCPQIRSQCVLSYRERSLDQTAICCITRGRFAVLPVSSPPPHPNRDARKTGANVLSPTYRERPLTISQYIIKSPSQLFYRAQINSQPCPPQITLPRYNRGPTRT